MRSRERRTLASFIAFAAFGATTALAQASPIARQVVAAVPQAAGIADRGRAGAGVGVDLLVRLNYRNEAELDRLIDAQIDAASPLHDQFLSSEQFRAYFSPTASTYARTVSLLRRAGFTITATSPSRTAIDVRAPAPVVERYFSTEIHLVAAGNSPTLRYANARPALLPNELHAVAMMEVDIDIGEA